jgi:hypothetical protein
MVVAVKAVDAVEIKIETTADVPISLALSKATSWRTSLVRAHEKS